MSIALGLGLRFSVSSGGAAEDNGHCRVFQGSGEWVDMMGNGKAGSTQGLSIGCTASYHIHPVLFTLLNCNGRIHSFIDVWKACL